ncbi:MAG: deoxyribonuclease IV [Nanoarchaeota archaeon]
MEKKLYIGAHSSISMGYLMALKNIDSIGGNSVQIFLKNPRGRSGKPVNQKDAKEALSFLKEKKMFLVGHCSYLLNFAKNPKEYSWSIESLIDDLKRIDQLGGRGVVLHIGKYLDMTKQIAYKNIVDSVNLVLARTPKNTKVIFENTAGQGTEIGYKFSELKEIYNLFNNEQKKRITFCIDTCHSHAAGYDLSTKSGVLNWIRDFENNIGIEKIDCIHLNDSQRDAGSKIDRHEDLTFGKIGKIGLIEIVNFAKNKNIPLILETPTRNLSYSKQIEMIKNNFRD